MGDPILWRGLERLIVVLGAIAFGYFGYRLYIVGVKNGRVSADADLKFAKIIMAGGGPGLGFMFMGGLIMVASLIGQEARRTKITTTAIPATPATAIPANEGSAAPGITVEEAVAPAK